MKASRKVTHIPSLILYENSQQSRQSRFSPIFLVLKITNKSFKPVQCHNKTSNQNVTSHQNKEITTVTGSNLLFTVTMRKEIYES